MNHDLDAVEGAAHDLGVAHVAAHVLRLGLRIRRPVGAGAVHLGVERVEHAHALALADERIHQVRTDEARSAGDENLHASPPWFGSVGG